jgi:ubiquitin-protein ligase
VEKNNSYKRVMSKYSFRMLDMDAEEIINHSDPKTTQAVTGGTTAAALRTASAAAASTTNRERTMAIKNTLAALKSSCPVDWHSSIFCLVDEKHFDRLTFLIIGPEGTPYQNGCFHFDMQLPSEFPYSPPRAIFLTTGGGKVRFNPNLYADGKICLSLLGTWEGPKWNAKESTVLQVLLSIQSLILCAEPYFNEPGYEASKQTKQGLEQSSLYNMNLRMQTVRLGMVGMLQNPPKAFESTVRDHFKLKATEILNQCEIWAKDWRGPPLDYAAMVAELRKALEANNAPQAVDC